MVAIYTPGKSSHRKQIGWSPGLVLPSFQSWEKIDYGYSNHPVCGTRHGSLSWLRRPLLHPSSLSWFTRFLLPRLREHAESGGAGSGSSPRNLCELQFLHLRRKVINPCLLLLEGIHMRSCYWDCLINGELCAGVSCAGTWCFPFLNQPPFPPLLDSSCPFFCLTWPVCPALHQLPSHLSSLRFLPITVVLLE